VPGGEDKEICDIHLQRYPETSISISTQLRYPSAMPRKTNTAFEYPIFCNIQLQIHKDLPTCAPKTISHPHEFAQD
jgi:hypothetical protein